jgi:hypothetical protein
MPSRLTAKLLFATRSSSSPSTPAKGQIKKAQPVAPSMRTAHGCNHLGPPSLPPHIGPEMAQIRSLHPSQLASSNTKSSSDDASSFHCLSLLTLHHNFVAPPCSVTNRDRPTPLHHLEELQQLIPLAPSPSSGWAPASLPASAWWRQPEKRYRVGGEGAPELPGGRSYGTPIPGSRVESATAIISIKFVLLTVRHDTIDHPG